MRILALSHFAPHPSRSGVMKRNFHLLESLARQHDVWLVSYGAPEYEQALRGGWGHAFRHIHFIDDRLTKAQAAARRAGFLLSGRSSMYWHRTSSFQREVDALLRRERFDVIFCSSQLFGFLRLPSHVPCIGNTHNVEYDGNRRTWEKATEPVRKLYAFFEYHLGRRDELRASRRFDVLLPTSERDLRLFRQDLPELRMEVIPNGVDLDVFTPSPVEPEPRTLVFTGMMGYYPNEHGILDFLERTFPHIRAKVPDVRLRIVGSHPSRRVRAQASPRVEVTGFVEDVRPYITRSEVFIVPLHIGGGTRLKALEAMAMGKPVVSTTLGCEGLEVRHGESVLLADTPEAFAGSVLRLFEDEALRARLSRAARACVAERYGWEAIGRRLETVLLQCARG